MIYEYTNTVNEYANIVYENTNSQWIYKYCRWIYKYCLWIIQIWCMNIQIMPVLIYMYSYLWIKKCCQWIHKYCRMNTLTLSMNIQILSYIPYPHIHLLSPGCLLFGSPWHKQRHSFIHSVIHLFIFWTQISSMNTDFVCKLKMSSVFSITMLGAVLALYNAYNGCQQRKLSVNKVYSG